MRRSIELIFLALDLENQDWLIIALFLRLVKGKPWTRTSSLVVWACHWRRKTRPRFCFRRMILVITFWEYMTRLSALVWSLVEPLSVFAADIYSVSAPQLVVVVLARAHAPQGLDF